MSAPPRSPKARLFEPILLQRGLAQGVGVLLLLLAVFGFGRELGASDEAARDLSFSALVLSNLILIAQNRSWGGGLPGWRGESGRKFSLLAAGVLGLLALVLWAPAVGVLFGFVAPPAPLLLLPVAAAALTAAWSALVKRVLR